MLSDEDKAVLDFAGRTYRYPGARETDLLEEFGWSAVTYWVKLDGLLDRPDAEASHPRLVRRLRSLREARRSARIRRDSGVYGVHARGLQPSETFR